MISFRFFINILLASFIMSTSAIILVSAQPHPPPNRAIRAIRENKFQFVSNYTTTVWN